MTEMITELTQEHYELIDKLRNKYLNYFFKEKTIDWQKLRTGVDFLYKMVELPSPFLVVTKSPLAAQYAAIMLVRTWGDNESDAKWKGSGKGFKECLKAGRLNKALQEYLSTMSADYSEINKDVWQDALHCLEEAFHKATNKVTVIPFLDASEGKEPIKDWLPFAWYGTCSDYGFIAFYEFFETLRDKDGKPLVYNETFVEMRSMLLGGVYDMVQLDEACIVSTIPDTAILDDRERMHSELGPALAWSDGYKVHLLEGVYFPYDLWHSITSKTITPSEIMALDNQEQKTVAMRCYGWDRMLKDTNAKVIDKQLVYIKPEQYVSIDREYNENGKRGNRAQSKLDKNTSDNTKSLRSSIDNYASDGAVAQSYDLIEVKLGDDDDRPARFVKVVCSSTLKEALLRVPPDDPQCNTALGAVAWTAGKTVEQYRLLMET